MWYRSAVALTCGLVAALALGTASGAGAGSAPSRVELRDPAGDVWEVDPAAAEPTPFGELPTVDVRRVLGAHRSAAVVVRTRFVDLRRVGRQQTQSALVDTPAGRYAAAVLSTPRRRAGRVHLIRTSGPGGVVRCDGLTHRIDYAADVVAIRLPRRCVGSPAWVRLNMASTLYTGGPDAPFYTDNPHNTGARPSFSRRLFRG